MKRPVITLIILFAVIFSGQAQDKLKIGEEKSGKLVITNPDGLKAFLMNSLNNSGSLGKDYRVSTSPEGDRCLIHYPVTGNNSNVSSIGVMLVKAKNDFYIIENPPLIESSTPGGGGSATITCTGNPCDSCYPDISWPAGRWFPLIVCKCEDPEGICNMSVSFSINVQIGL